MFCYFATIKSIRALKTKTAFFMLSLLIGFCMSHRTFAGLFIQLQTDTMIKGNYADVNGIKMYYEIRGEGKPLVLIHGGGSTIETTFGKTFPLFAKKYK